ncbi:sensor histidine kinase [Sphingobacterium puteale]|uniref:sensor histidine kinase n=1 Tax=Sphingobacterium puteale TaxID=2420510 RepID=UPI003D9A0A95
MERTKVVLMHIAVWVIYVSILIFNLGYSEKNWNDFIYETTVSHLISVGVFYSTTLWILPQFYAKNKYTKTLAGFLCILIASEVSRFIYTYSVSPVLLGRRISSSTLPLDTQLVNFFFQWFKFSLLGVLYWSRTSKIELQKKLTDQIAESSKREKLELENAALRAQINPHFIFNTLEVLRREASEISPNVSYGIECFMDILRSGINKLGPDGKIPLLTEIRAIEGIVYLYSKRFPELIVSLVSDVENHETHRIHSHVLLPLVENAFKHGDKKITVELSVDRTAVKLNVNNIIGRRIKDESTGIGLSYVKRILESNYPNTYKLKTIQTKENYSAELIIHFN